LIIKLLFSLKLEKFILKTYAGSSSTSSYKSNVVLIDEKNIKSFSYSIYMNHILKYKGWHFYQSSYDNDEKGTILSVNKDISGMTVTYTGYFMLILFIILSMFNKRSLFRTLQPSFFCTSVPGKLLLILLIFFAGSKTYAQDNKLLVQKPVANEFGNILVQDQKGRTKPVNARSKFDKEVKKVDERLNNCFMIYSG